MPRFQPRDDGFEARVRTSFAKQRAMDSLRARLLEVEPGRVCIEMPFCDSFTQQHGFLHAGAVTSILDSACGYAALSLMESGGGVLTVEFKTNLLAPASGQRFVAEGTVIKSGRSLMVCEGRATAIDNECETLVATMSATMMVMGQESGLVG